MEEDEELKKIRERKLKQMLGQDNETSRAQSKLPPHNEPIEVTDTTFPEIIRNHPLVVVDCWASWCGPCFMIAPIIEEMARDFAGKIVFGKLNVDENRGIPQKYQIMSIPTLLVFKNGTLVDRIIGAMPRQMLEPKITRHLS